MNDQKIITIDLKNGLSVIFGKVTGTTDAYAILCISSGSEKLKETNDMLGILNLKQCRFDTVGPAIRIEQMENCKVLNSLVMPYKNKFGEIKYGVLLDKENKISNISYITSCPVKYSETGEILGSEHFFSIQHDYYDYKGNKQFYYTGLIADDKGVVIRETEHYDSFAYNETMGVVFGIFPTTSHILSKNGVVQLKFISDIRPVIKVKTFDNTVETATLFCAGVKGFTKIYFGIQTCNGQIQSLSPEAIESLKRVQIFLEDFEKDKTLTKKQNNSQ